MSTSRENLHYLATDGKWYVQLGDFEGAWEPHQCTDYGPFDNQEACDDYVSANHSNPGHSEIDASGVETPPSDPEAP